MGVHSQFKWLLTNEFPHNNQPKIGVHISGEYGGEIQQAGSAGEL